MSGYIFSDPNQDKALKFLPHLTIGVSEGIGMIGIGELESMLMATNGIGDSGAFAKKPGSQKGASNHSLAGLEQAEEGALLAALGLIDERNKRIQGLKEKIAAGRYFVASGELAERMMAAMMVD
jgi:anti-sigma28 factor (negative regulator of flagellin synthesis)